MARETDVHRFPAGTGWTIGYLFGVVLGIVAWRITSEVVIGVIVLAATGPTFGVVLEQSLDTRPLTATQRRSVRVLAIAGVVVGVVVLLYLLLT